MISRSISYQNPYDTSILTYDYYKDFHMDSFRSGRKNNVHTSMGMPNQYYFANLIVNSAECETEDLIYYFMFIESRGTNVRRLTLNTSFFNSLPLISMKDKEKITLLDIAKKIKNTDLIYFLSNATCYTIEKDNSINVILQ